MTTHFTPPSTPANGFTLDSSHMHLVVQAEGIAVPRAHDPMRVLVTGSRDYANPGAVAAVLWGVALTHGPLHITEGGADGLDELAEQFAKQENWSHEAVLADWQAPCVAECNHGPRRWRRRRSDVSYTYCPAQGNYRNQVMVDQGHDLCVGWFSRPKSDGTRDCLTRAYRAGIPTFAVRWEEADLFHEDRWAVRRFVP